MSSWWASEKNQPSWWAPPRKVLVLLPQLFCNPETQVINAETEVSHVQKVNVDMTRSTFGWKEKLHKGRKKELRGKDIHPSILCFLLWEENPHMNKENLQTPHKRTLLGFGPGSSFCVVRVLTTTPPYSPKKRLKIRKMCHYRKLFSLK